MTFNNAGLLLLKSFEGFRPQAYLDVGDVPTIGWGFTENVKLGDTITEDEAEIRLEKEISRVCDSLKPILTCSLNDNQFSAVVCLVYNIGYWNFHSSTMRALLNNNDLAGAALEFERWDRVHHVEVSGLLRRREAEKLLFLS